MMRQTFDEDGRLGLPHSWFWAGDALIVLSMLYGMERLAGYYFFVREII